MAIYRWNKYSYDYAEPSSWSYLNNNYFGIVGLYKSYTWDKTTGEFVGSGGQWTTSDPIYEGIVSYRIQGGRSKIIEKHVAKESGSPNTVVLQDVYRKDANGAIRAKGSYIDQVTSTNRNAYPDDGPLGLYYYVYVGMDNTSPTTPGPFTSPASGTILNRGQIYTFDFGNSTDADGDAITYEIDIVGVSSYFNTSGSGWISIATNVQGSQYTFAIPSNWGTNQLQMRVRAKDSRGSYSGYAFSPIYTINSAPTVTLNTTNNRTLYENDTLTIDGQATDTDSGNVISVKYKIDNGTYKTIDAKVSDGSTPLSFSKSLTFKQGKLYDRETAITGDLETGVAHTLTVWSEDDQGGKSADVVRTFYVVPNRAPQITVDPFAEQSNLINADIITISGTASDPENDNVVVSYQLNGGIPVEVYNGAPGNWSFDLQLKSLQKGDNTVVLEVTDIYGVKTSKTLKITKTPNTIPLKNAVAVWKITPPAGSAQEVLAWIQREIGDLAVNAEVSMTNAGEQENFVPMTLTNTAPVNSTIAEDEFNYLAASTKDTIILKLNLSRTDTNSDKGIKLVSGGLE